MFGTPRHAGCDGPIRPVGVSCTTKRWRFWSDGRPYAPSCGSFNWSKRSAAGYENLIVFTRILPSVDARDEGAVEREFEAPRSDGAATLSPDEVRTHFAAILAEYREIRRVLPPMWSG